MAAPQQAKPAMSPEASVLAPGVKVPQGAQGYLLTLVQQARARNAIARPSRAHAPHRRAWQLHLAASARTMLPTRQCHRPRAPAHAALPPLARAQNAWWKVNTCLEAMELIKSAYKDINGADVMPPALEPHAVAGAPGALFIAQGAAQGAKDASPVAIAHRLLEMVATDKEAAAMCAARLVRVGAACTRADARDACAPLRSGEHLMRVLPVEETCTVDNSEIEAMADKLMRKHLPEGGQPMTARSAATRAGERCCCGG
jgi:hypothetical protein